MFTTGQPICYAEIKDSEAVKRVALPQNDANDVELRLRAFLSKNPGLTLIRFGQTVAASIVVTQPSLLFVGFKYMEKDRMIDTALPGHPEISQGAIRISQDFCTEVMATEVFTPPVVTQQPVIQEQPAPVQEKVLSPEEQLRIKMNPVSVVAQPEPPQQPTVPAQEIIQPTPPIAPPGAVESPSDIPPLKEQLERAAQRNLASQQPVGVSKPLSTGSSYGTRQVGQASLPVSMIDLSNKLDDLQTEIRLLRQSLKVPTGEALTGKALQIWFSQTSVDHGMEAPFEILAKMIGNLPE
jgi:hypothetical protein